MRRFFSYWPVWIFGFLILSPNFLVNLVCQSKSLFSLSGIYFSILSLLLFLTALVIFRVVWIACLILLPFIILLPMELFYIWEYKFPSTAGIIATVFATNYQEAAEYASSYLVYLIIGMILILMVSLFCIYRMKASKLRMKLRFSKAVLVGVIIFLCFAFLKNVIKSNYNILDGTNKTITNIGRTYPFGVLIRFAKFYHEYERSLFYEKNTKNFRFGAFRKRDISGKEVYVLVIGESSRYDHWGINGYKRDTSPTLSKLRHLISFSNIITWFARTNESI
jgi:glucan phosphoethanolaminetransferase (alkaline phosphatase superfamily)